MKLTYNVLCVDDRIKSLDEEKKFLSNFNMTVGIKTKYTDIEVKPSPREEPTAFLKRILTEIKEAFAKNIYY